MQHFLFNNQKLKIKQEGFFMKNIFKIIVFNLIIFISIGSFAKDENTFIIETNRGNITIEVFPEKAPKTVTNFKKYVEDGFYNGLIFHRVILTG